jgi:hypothetical protein
VSRGVSPLINLDCFQVFKCVAFVTAMLSSGSSWGQTTCLDDNGQPPPVALTGTLKERRLVSSPSPAVPRGPFYTLELDKPTCLHGAFSETVVRDIRSVHVYSQDAKTQAVLKRHRGKRVSVRFADVFEEHTAHHRRPMVGTVETVTPLR